MFVILNDFLCCRHVHLLFQDDEGSGLTLSQAEDQQLVAPPPHIARQVEVLHLCHAQREVWALNSGLDFFNRAFNQGYEDVVGAVINAADVSFAPEDS